MTKILEQNGKTENKANYHEVTRKQSMGKRNWSYTGLFHTPGVQGHPPAIVGLPKNRFPSGLLTSGSSHIFLWKQKQNPQRKKEGLIQTAARNSFIYAFYILIFYIIQSPQLLEVTKSFITSSNTNYFDILKRSQQLIWMNKNISSCFLTTSWIFYYRFLSGNLFNLCSSNTNSCLLKGNYLTIAEAHRKGYFH